MHPALRAIFEEQLAFSLEDGERILGRVFVGDTEILPVKVLQSDEQAYRFEFTNWQDEKWLPVQETRRNDLLKLLGNSGRYAELRQAVARDRVVPFVGSGMSVPTGLPTWKHLLISIAEQVSGETISIEKLLLYGKFEDVVDEIVARTNRNLFNERIEHSLQLDGACNILGAVRLLPVLFPELVVSTNLDPVVERLFMYCGMPFDTILTGADIASFRKLSAKGDRILLKLHGDYQKPATRILSSVEYDAAYGEKGVAREELGNLYRNRALLFLGCSLLNDRTLDIIKEIAEQDANCPKHFSFSPLPDSRADQVDRENSLTRHGIFPIWYDGDHDECILALLTGLLENPA